VDDALEQNVDRGAEKNDGVKAVIELALVRDAAGDEQPATPVAVENCGDSVDVPDRLGPVGCPAVNDPACLVAVDGLVPAAGEQRQRGGFARPGHAGHQHNRPLRNGTASAPRRVPGHVFDSLNDPALGLE